jgi:hypothetical protein
MKSRTTLWIAGITVTLATAQAAQAQTRMTGSWDANEGPRTRHAEYTCLGAPTCTGSATIILTNSQCSNNRFVFTVDLTLTGVDLSRAGTFTGSWTGSKRICETVNADGSCTWAQTGAVTWPYTANWDGTRGSMNIDSTRCNGQQLTRLGPFTGAAPSASPVFPMTVTGSITETVASATAQIQPRSQDVGRSVSVYVFAHAPLGTPAHATEKRDTPGDAIPMRPLESVTCVLAQLNPQGQLAPVSASSMTAATTGILSSQGQSVSILNNVPTSNVGGATFFVGYGGTATEMLANGVYQSAVSIPGDVQCTASIAAAPAAASPGALTGLYWNASESGWGIHFTQRAANIFAAWYTYDGNGAAKWYVVPNCLGINGASGTCNGTLYEVSGTRFFGAAFDTSRVTAAAAGTFQARFDNTSGGAMTYSVAGQTRTVSLARQPLATGTFPPAVDYTDLWWNPGESGWGMAITQQFNIAFLAWYVYDTLGRPSWLVATCPMSGSGCAGTLYRTTGPGFGPTFDAGRVVATPAGTIAVNFNDANNALVSYTVDGVTATKTITRQIF